MGRWLGIADETVFGTPVTPPTDFRDCLGIGLHPEREEMKVEGATIIGPVATKPGSYKIVGDIEIAPSSENIHKLLKYLFGVPTSTQDGANDRWKHEYIPSATLKFATLYKADDIMPDGTNSLQYTSVIAVEARLEAALNAPVSLTFGMLGQKDKKVATTSLGTIPTIKPFFSIQGKCYWDLAQTTEEVNIDSISFTFRRVIPDDYFTMNNAFLQGFLVGEASLEGTLDLLFKTWKGYEKFWGNTTGPITEPPYAVLDLDFKGESLGGTGEYEFHRMRWQLPAISITRVEEPFETAGKIVQTLGFSGARGTIDSDVVLAKCILYNTIATP